MHSVSNTTVHENIISQKDHKFRTRVDIGYESYYDDKLISVVTRMHAFGTNTLEFGQAYSREIELSLFVDNNANQKIPRNAQIDVWVLPVSGDGVLSGSWIHKGQFFIDTRSKDSQTVKNTNYDGSTYNEEVVNIVGFDAMMRGEAVFNTFPDSWMSEGKTDAKSLIRYAAENLEVQIDDRTWRVMSANRTEEEKNFPVLLPTQYSIRESLRYVAALYGGSFIINDEGMLQLIAPWYTERFGDTCTVKDSPQGLTIIPPHDYCSGVRMLVKMDGYKKHKEKEEGEEENEDDEVEYEEIPEGYEAGSNSGYMFEIESPWGTQDQVDWLYGKLSGYQYMPYQVETAELDPRAEIGDKIRVKNGENVETVYALFSQEITFGPYLTSDFGAPGEEAIDHEYTYETSTERRFSRRLEQTEATLSIYEDEINAKVSKKGSSEGFGWSLQLDKWIVYSGDEDNIVLKADKDGLNVSGYISSSEIYIPDSEDPQFSVNRNGKMTARGAEVYGNIYVEGGIYLGDENTPVATSSDLEAIRSMSQGGYYNSTNGSGLLNALQAADKLNKCMLEGSEENLTLNTLSVKTNCYSQHFWVGDDFPYTDLRTHLHSIEFKEDGDKITLYLYEPITPYDESHYKFASFNIAATQKYQDMVAALTITSVDVGFSQTTDGKGYDATVYIRKADGNLIENPLVKPAPTFTTSSNNGVWWNGYNSRNSEVESLENSVEYWQGKAEYWEDLYSNSASWSDGYWDGFIDTWNNIELLSAYSGHARISVVFNGTEYTQSLP